MTAKNSVPLWHRLTLKDREVAELLSISRTSWLVMYKSFQTPDPILLNTTRVWRTAEIRDWIRAGIPPNSEWRWPKKPANG